MTVKFKAEINFKNLGEQLLESVAKNLEVALSDQRDIITENAQKSKGYAGNFGSSNSEYMQYKARVGRNKKRDLFLTGQLMQSIQTAVSRQVKGIKGRIFVLDADGTKPPEDPAGEYELEIVSVAEKAIRTDERFKWLGLSDKDKDRILNYLRTKLKL